MPYVLFIFLFIFSFCQEVFGEDYAGSRESSGEVFQTKPHKVDEYAGHWAAELPKSCRQLGVRGETNFNIHRNLYNLFSIFYNYNLRNLMIFLISF